MKRIFVILLYCVLSSSFSVNAINEMPYKASILFNGENFISNVFLPELKWEDNPNVSNLYFDFNNQITHNTSPVPESFNVNLAGFTMPVKYKRVSSRYGWRWNRMHRGIDLSLNVGDTVRSAFEGKVRKVGFESKGYGNYVIVRHPNGLETYYAHLHRILVHPNQIVKSGEPIGLGGNTGRSTGPHLHFETRICGQDFNPESIIDFNLGTVLFCTFTFNRHQMQNQSGKYYASKKKKRRARKMA